MSSALVPVAIVAALTPVFGAKVYPKVAPDGTLPPFAIYGGISTTPEVTLSDGIPIDSERVQIDIYAEGYLECRTLSQSVIDAMLAIAQPLSVVPLTEEEVFDGEVKLYRHTQDYNIWQPRSES